MLILLLLWMIQLWRHSTGNISLETHVFCQTFIRMKLSIRCVYIPSWQQQFHNEKVDKIYKFRTTYCHNLWIKLINLVCTHVFLYHFGARCFGLMPETRDVRSKDGIRRIGLRNLCKYFETVLLISDLITTKFMNNFQSIHNLESDWMTTFREVNRAKNRKKIDVGWCESNCY
jgi:hypothetical protein